MHSIAPQNKINCRIDLDISVTAKFPGEDQLFITGNLPELGDWDPAGTMLSPKTPGNYEITLSAPADSIIEFKLTRGTWKTQGIFSEEDIPPSNLVIKAVKDRRVKVKIIDWLDQQTIESDPVIGTIKTIEGLEAEGLRFPLSPIQVWLPECYSETSEPFAVIYMHDGQNLFEPCSSFAGVDWKVDETASALMKKNEIRNCIVVGIPNSPDRMKELNLFTGPGKAYAKFVANVVKPYIDSNFNVLTDSENTFVMGSSMGGLMAFQMVYAMPHIFGGGGCVSSAFGRTFGKIFQLIEKSAFMPPGVKFYLDTGEYEPPIVKSYFKMIHLLKKKGFIEGFNLMGYFDEKATHCEAAWAKRLSVPLKFLLRK